MYKVVIIGSGNVAWHLAHYLPFCGGCITQIYSRNKDAAEALAASLGTDFTSNVRDIYSNADFYIYAIKDDALSTVIQAVEVENGIHLHTSGAVDISVFDGRKKNFGVLYPFQTFSKQRKIDLNQTPLFIEANTNYNLQKISDFANKISLKVYELTSEQRIKVHLAGVFANNFTNYLWNISYNLLKSNNLPFSVIMPLIKESIDKLNYLTPEQAQTGPAKRGDQNVIKAHLELLANNKNLQKIYELISEEIKLSDSSF